jgi:hypothetical protein
MTSRKILESWPEIFSGSRIGSESEMEKCCPNFESDTMPGNVADG